MKTLLFSKSSLRNLTFTPVLLSLLLFGTSSSSNRFRHELCPGETLRDIEAGTCVTQCPPNKEIVARFCIPCNGPCPKRCPAPTNNGGIIHSGNIETFRNCTIIYGSITIHETSFTGFQEIPPTHVLGIQHPPMNPNHLEAFNSVKQVTGFIKVKASHPNFKDLSFLRNLETIGGQEQTDYSSSLYIVGTSLISLNLNSLKVIKRGRVTILDNPNLCYVHTINWGRIMWTHLSNKVTNNTGEEECMRRGDICSPNCSHYWDGCWGPKPTDCLHKKTKKQAATTTDTT